MLGEPAVGDLNGDGNLEIAATFANESLGVWRAGDCTLLTSLSGSQPWGAADVNHTSAADLDGDGVAEILVRLLRLPDGTPTSSHWAAFNLHYDPGTDSYSLAYLWTTQDILDAALNPLVGSNGNNFNATPAFADLDADGSPEIIVAFAATGFNDRALLVVFNALGAIEWQYLGDFHDLQSPAPKVDIVDLDLDGTLEVLHHTAILSHTGAVEGFWPVPNAGTLDASTRTMRLDTTVANLDDDPYPEVYARNSNTVYIFDHDRSELFSESIVNQDAQLPVTVAQLDDDPEPELALVNFIFDALPGANNHLHVYEHTGQLKWRHVTATSGAAGEIEDPTGGTLFRGLTRVQALDVDQDGIDELLVAYREQNALTVLYVFNADGTVRLQHTLPNLANNVFIAPVIANLDDDPGAEILWVRGGFPNSLTVFDAVQGTHLPPVRAQKVQWNDQPTFANPDGTIPALHRPTGCNPASTRSTSERWCRVSTPTRWIAFPTWQRTASHHPTSHRSALP